MKTSIQDIENNEITAADHSQRPFDFYSKQFHTAFRMNTSINKLDLSLSDLDDELFIIIAEILLNRTTKLLELNLDANYPTVDSISSIQKLILNKKIDCFLIYKNDGIDANPQVMQDLIKFATENNAKVTNENPLERKYPGLFDRLRADQRGNPKEDYEQKKTLK